MNKSNPEILSGVIIESETPLTLEELANAIHLHDEIIRQMV